jgi:hypothetical protein
MKAKLQGKAGQLDENTRQWLESQPELGKRPKEMRWICENGGRENELLAKAEAGLVEQLDAVGRELVGAWLEKREEQEHEKARTQRRMRERGKKPRVLTVFGEAGVQERVIKGKGEGGDQVCRRRRGYESSS